MTGVPSIKKLDETVINRIAAGEVIQRPANALKEMLENSLDAKGTNIQVVAKQGGLKFLQIQDNGIGIRKEDLGIVCERFTTSKLTKFEDLSKISTYGFRGEALASISHVAHLTITTKTADSVVGYRASYEESQLKGTVKPCAATQGTQITVEDLFFNIPTRKKALKNPNEEHGKIVQVVSKYAIHNSDVAFSLKKQGESTSDVKTPQNSSVTENIKIIYGNSVAKELMEINSNDDTLKFQLKGYMTNVNYSTKKLIFLLFINNRLVDSSGLRKVIELVYSTYLPKNSHPFVYLSINIDPQNVDVNIHPTKHEVHFLHEEAITQKIKESIENHLLGANSSRVLYTQSKLPTMLPSNVDVNLKTKNPEKKLYAHNTVRTDSNEQKLDKFFKQPTGMKQDEDRKTKTEENKSEGQDKRIIKLKSILQLQANVENSVHHGLVDIIRNLTFVGVVNPSQCLIQHDTKLYLCNTEKLFEEHLYQAMLFEFANYGVIRFSSPISVKELALLFFDEQDSGWVETDGTKEELAEAMSELMRDKAKMLEDYFSLEVDESGNLCTLPLLIDNYNPNIGQLPKFVARVCTEVDWNLEKPCLQGICKELATFYSKIQVVNEDDSGNMVDSNWKWVTEHVIIPSMKETLLPPTCFSQDGTILQIANLSDLYKVFERC